jgi:hypothetical protein
MTIFNVDQAVKDIESKTFYQKVVGEVKKAFNNPANYRVEVQELSEPMLKRIEEEILQCCNDHDDAPAPIYIHLIHVRDPISANVLRTKLFVRFSRPRPLPDSYLFRYHRNSGIEFQWCLPEESIIEMMLTHPERDKKFDKDLIKFMQVYRFNLDNAADFRA